MDEANVRHLMESLKCVACGEQYKVENISVVGHQDDTWFMNVYCPFCQSQSLVAAVVKEGVVPEVITDLTESEIKKFKDVESVSADDILDIHQFLNRFEGDISSLFTELHTDSHENIKKNPH